MTEVEFTKEATRLLKTYGDKAFPQERLQLVFKKFQHYPSDLFAEVISEVIADCISVPNITKMQEYANVVKGRRQDVRVDPFAFARERILQKSKEQTTCRHCQSGGIVTAIRKGDPHNYEWDFLCNCGAGALCAQLPEHRGLQRKDFGLEMEFVSKWSEEYSEVLNENLTGGES